MKESEGENRFSHSELQKKGKEIVELKASTFMLKPRYADLINQVKSGKSKEKIFLLKN